MFWNMLERMNRTQSEESSNTLKIVIQSKIYFLGQNGLPMTKE